MCRFACSTSSLTFLAAVIMTMLSGCTTESSTTTPYRAPTWGSIETEASAKNHDKPTGLRCTVLPQARLGGVNLLSDNHSHSLAEITELRRTKGRDIPVFALATLPRLADGSVQKGYTIHPSTESRESPRFVGLTFGAKNFKKSGRFIEFHLDVEYTAMDGDVRFEDKKGSVIPIPIFSTCEVNTNLAMAPDQTMAFGIPGQAYVLLIEFTFE